MSCYIMRVHLVSKFYRSLLVIAKMAITLNCREFLMLAVFAALSTAIISKPACKGDSVLIFQNITSARFNKTITLYKTSSGKNDTMALWLQNDYNVESKVMERYRSKVSFENGSIILRNIESTDEAAYVLLYDKDISTKSVTNISTLVPPTNKCKLTIRQDKNVLFAFLDNPNYCGTPQASVRWMDYPGISYKDNKTVIEVPSGKDASIYHACIVGEVLMCTRTSADREYCENITIGYTRIESIPIPSSDIQQIEKLTIAIAVIVSLILLVVIITLIIIRWKHCRVRHKEPEREPSREQRIINRSESQDRNVTDSEQGQYDTVLETDPLQEGLAMGLMP